MAQELLEADLLEVVFQPIVSNQYKTVVGYEGLSRPSVCGKSVPPDEWFKLAYLRGIGVEADIRAVDKMIREFGKHVGEIERAQLFVNVIPHSLLNYRFHDAFAAILQDTGFKATDLVFEIVESVSYDLVTMAKVMDRMRCNGVRFAIDDVGSGTASLRALVELEPDFVKIDKSFIQHISSNSKKQKFLTAIRQSLDAGQRVIAEGVEDEEDLDAISAAGVDISQGYHWSRPRPLSELRGAWMSWRR